MVIVAKYDLIENPERGVFCKELGAEFLSMLWWSTNSKR